MESAADGFVQAALIAGAVIALPAICSAVVLLRRGATSDAAAIVLKVSGCFSVTAVALAIALTVWMQNR